MSFSKGKETTKNVFWAYFSFFSTKVLNLVAIIIVARYVDPAEFGTMALCLAIMGYFAIISRFGLGSALISATDNIEETANAVFYSALGLSSLMAFILWASSGWLADNFGTPMLEPLLAVLALSLVISAISTVNGSFLYKELRLKEKVVPDVVSGFVKGMVSIILAIMGFGVWALAIGHLAGAFAGSATLLWIRPWRPGQLPKFATVVSVTKYGSNLIGAETINSTPRLLDNLLIGKAFGPAVLGIYALAYRIPEIGIKTFTTVAGTVLHPVMSKIQHDEAEIRSYFYLALRYCALLMFGVGAMIAVLSDPLVRVLYSPKWYDMIVPMQMIAIAFALSTLNMVPGNFLKAVNRTDLLFRVSLINLPMFVIVIVVAVPYGITAVAMAQILLSILRFIPTYMVTKRVMDVTVTDTISALWPAIVCAGSGSLAAYATQYFLDGPVLIRLLAGGLAYAAAFLAALKMTMPEIFAAGTRFIARKLGAI